MKKNIRYTVSAMLMFLMAVSASGCKGNTADSSVSASSVSTSESSAEASSASSSSDTSSSASSSQSSQDKNLISFSLGNDIGRNISALAIKPESVDTWVDIDLGKVWASGYMIPVTVSSTDIAKDELWELKVTYEDDKTEEIFGELKLENDSSIIITADGVVY